MSSSLALGPLKTAGADLSIPLNCDLIDRGRRTSFAIGPIALLATGGNYEDRYASASKPDLILDPLRNGRCRATSVWLDGPCCNRVLVYCPWVWRYRFLSAKPSSRTPSAAWLGGDGDSCLCLRSA